MTKYGFDYFVKRAEVIEEMARPISHPVLTSVMDREELANFARITSDMGQRVKSGMANGKPLIDSQGIDAPGITKAEGAPDDRFNKWLLLGFIEASNTDKIKHIDPSAENIDILANETSMGDTLRQKYEPGMEYSIIEKLIREANNSSALPNQARRIVLNKSIEDKRDYYSANPKGAALFKSAMGLIIKDNPGILKASQLHDILYDPTTLADFINRERVIMGSKRSTNAAMDRANTYGKGTEDTNVEELPEIMHGIHKTTSGDILPLLNAISKQHGYKYGTEDKYTMGKRRKKDVDVGEGEIETVNSDIPTLISGLLKYLKAQAEAVDSKIRSYPHGSHGEKRRVAADDLDVDLSYIDAFADADLDLIDELISILQRIEQSGEDFSIEDFYELMDAISESKGEDPDVDATLDFIESQIYIHDKLKNAAQQSETASKGQYKGFDPNILKAILDTPEKVELFDKWYEEIYLPKKLAAIDKLIGISLGEISGNKQEELRQIQNFQKATHNKYGMPVDRSQVFQEEDPETVRKDLLARTDGIPFAQWSEYDKALSLKLGMGHRETVTNRDEAKAYGQLVNQARSKLHEDSYVMGYMSEQVEKDKFKPKGEFKDRGFKKPVNYAHWMDLNQ